MRSPNFWGIAVRTPSGDMDLRAERFRSITRKSKLFRLPIIRGALSLGETLWLGMKALTLSTNIALGEEHELRVPARTPARPRLTDTSRRAWTPRPSFPLQG